MGAKIWLGLAKATVRSAWRAGGDQGMRITQARAGGGAEATAVGVESE